VAAVFCDLTESQLALRDELRAYFSGLLSPGERAALLTERHGTVYRDVVRRMGHDGWLGVGWPPEYGGRGLGQVEQQIFVSEAARADVPLPAVTLQTVGPVLQARGTAGQKEFFLPRILAGQLHFAIGYTEPEAGTDLASLRTRAVRDGDTYLVNGEKIFTTGGHDADYIWLACRTDTGAPKHKGISILIVDTTDPGFSWTPIITHDGAHHTNATYYSDVRVPVTMRVGEENAGWQLVTAQLNHERVMLGPAGRIAALYDRVCGWAERAGLLPSPTSGGRWRGPTPACGSTSCSTGRWRRRPRWRSRTRRSRRSMPPSGCSSPASCWRRSSGATATRPMRRPPRWPAGSIFRPNETPC
jgi:3-oxo-4-pregnene-20-carboxyl-CoA dehydrogenase beta subunit